MLTTEQINDLHRLYWSEHWPIRKIEHHLHMGWETIKKYLDMPAQLGRVLSTRPGTDMPSGPCATVHSAVSSAAPPLLQRSLPNPSGPT